VQLHGIALAGFLTEVTRREAAIVESFLYSAGVARQNAAIEAVWYATGWNSAVPLAMSHVLLSPRLMERIQSIARHRSAIERKWLVQVQNAIVSWRDGITSKIRE